MPDGKPDTADSVRRTVVEELAGLLSIGVEAVEAQITDSGGGWPGDSLLLVEVLVAVEENLDVIVPMDEETMRALASVDGLVRRVRQVMEGVTR